MTTTTMSIVAARIDPADRGSSRQITVAYGQDHARVELDRDRWVDRHADAEELDPAFQSAVERCQDAGVWRIWLDGSNREFSWSAGGRWITLLVPVYLVQDAVAALKAAELRSDLSRINRLTAKMAAPFDEWLAPGERHLELGADFTCTPQHFLELLRAKAKGFGLKLNGRVDRNGVWVRPERTTVERARRQLLPERYGSDPDPYVSGAAATRSRPPAPYRHRSSHAQSEVRFLPADNLDRPCPCGWGGDDKRHDRQHVRWSAGIPIPSRLIFVRPIAVIDVMAPMAWRKLAYECARIAQRDGRYDFSSFPSPSEEPEPSNVNLRAVLLATWSRVIGYLSVVDSIRNASWDFNPSSTLSYGDDTLRPQVNLIFVAKEWRRRGVATALVRAMAADAKTEVAEISWSQPFSTAGQALAKSLSKNRVWVS